MTTRARCFICVLAVPLAALLSCTSSAKAPATGSHAGRRSKGRPVHRLLRVRERHLAGREPHPGRSCRAGVGAPPPARRTGSSCRSCSEELSASRRLASGKHRATARRSLRVVHGRGRIEAPGLTPLAPLLADIDARPEPADLQRIIRRLHDLAIPVAVRDRRRLGLPRARTLHRQRRRRRPGLVRPRQLPQERAALRGGARAVPGARRARPRTGGMAGRARPGVRPRHSRARDAPRRGVSRPRGGGRPGRDRPSDDLRAARAARAARRLGARTSTRPGCRGSTSTSPSRSSSSGWTRSSRETPLSGLEGVPPLAAARLRLAVALEILRRCDLRLRGRAPTGRDRDQAAGASAAWSRRRACSETRSGGSTPSGISRRPPRRRRRRSFERCWRS